MSIYTWHSPTVTKPSLPGAEKRNAKPCDETLHLVPGHPPPFGPKSHLRREVGNRPAVGAHRRAGAVEVAEPEVSEFHLFQTARARKQDVVQLHVAVADVLVVRVPHPANDLGRCISGAERGKQEQGREPLTAMRKSNPPKRAGAGETSKLSSEAILRAMTALN